VNRALTAAVMVLALGCAACGSDGGRADEQRELTVAAAASLTAAFTDVGAAFHEARPQARVSFTFGPSDGLATQIVEGAPIDVFASASPTWMDLVETDGPGVSGRTDFARNRLAIIVPAGNPAGIERIADLAREGVQLVLAAEGVPAGDYARQILENAGIADAALANVVSNEEDVALVLTKVLSGDADAGIAYVTDATTELAGQIELIEIPDDVNVIATYPIAIVKGTEKSDLAREFVDFVLGPGRTILAGYGFLGPS
jgi:molybdate transport system substrate-binding protein